MEIPAFKVDARYGDIHRFGNPHYWLDPLNAEPIMNAILGGLMEASPENLDPEKMAEWAEQTMNKFQAGLTLVKMRRFQESSEKPYSGWEWDEGTDFT